MDMETIKSLLNDFDPMAFIPELDSLVGWLELAVRVSVLAGPVILLFLGLWYLLLPPKEANHSAGYRTYWGMGSVEAWRFCQKIAGIAWGALGLVLTVVMVLITNGYRGMDAMDMVYSAVKCILWEIGLAVVSSLAINITMMVLFDRKGERRSKKQKKEEK